MAHILSHHLTPARQRVSGFIQFVRQPQYRWLTRPLLAFIVTRLIVFFAAYIAEIAIPSISDAGVYHVNPDNVLLDVWARWDSAFYLRIVEQGYNFAPGQQSSVAFFPVYPLLTSFATSLVGDKLLAAVLVSNACLLGALILLYRLTELEFGDAETASRAVFYIAAFPTAFFFSAVYTESTFLLFSVGTLYFARKRQWGWAALFGILCSASRIIGFLVWGLVVLEWLRAHGWTFDRIRTRAAWAGLWDGLRRDWFNLLVICLIPLGLISYMAFLYQQFGDPIAFSTTQSAWGRQTVGPWATIGKELARLASGDFLKGEIWYRAVLDLGAFFAVIGITAAIWQRLGTGYAIYCLLSILIPASSGTFSLSRYALVIFPMFMLLGHWGRHPVVDRGVVFVFSVLLGMMTTIFVNWIFIA